jgi:hypothetical protein
MLLRDFLKSYSGLRAKRSVNLETTTNNQGTKKSRQRLDCARLSAAFFPAEDHPHSQGFRPPESADKSDALQTLRAFRKLSPGETLPSFPAIRLVNNSRWNFGSGVL